MARVDPVRQLLPTVGDVDPTVAYLAADRPPPPDREVFRAVRAVADDGRVRALSKVAEVRRIGEGRLDLAAALASLLAADGVLCGRWIRRDRGSSAGGG